MSTIEEMLEKASKSVVGVESIAVEKAREIGVKVISLTGKPESALGKLADIDICTPGGRFADRVQELHIKVIHTLIELVERQMFDETYED